MIPKSLIESYNFIDIETVGLYPTLSECRKNDPHLADLWIKRCKWLQKNIEAGESPDPEDLWLNKSSLHPEFGKIVCVSFGVFSSDLSLERMSSFYGADEKEVLEKTNKISLDCTAGFSIVYLLFLALTLAASTCSSLSSSTALPLMEPWKRRFCNDRHENTGMKKTINNFYFHV